MEYPTVLLRARNLEPAAKAVLVKFNFSNPKWIPSGIPRRQRNQDCVVDAAHAMIAAAAAKPELAAIGRVRPGRVDTGNHTIDNAQNVQVGILRRGLANIGYALQDAHWFLNPDSQKSVVVMCYVPLMATEGIEKIKLSASTLGALRALSTTVWGYCHVWENPDGNVTINCVGRSPDAKPHRVLAIREGSLELRDIEGLLPEDQESEMSMDAAFHLFRELGFNPHAADVKQVADKFAEAAERHG